MKTLRNFLVTIILLIGVEVAAQSAWSTGRFYQYKGTVQTICGDPYPTWDNYGNYTGMFKTCKTTVWRQEWRSGYTWYWNYNSQRWYKKWYEGYAWQYRWNYTYHFVRW